MVASLCFCGEVDHYLSWGQTLVDATPILNSKINEIINTTIQSVAKDCSCEKGNLTILTYLSLSDNSLSGLIPKLVCELDYPINLNYNQFCSPYYECSKEFLGEQDCLIYETFDDLNGNGVWG